MGETHTTPEGDGQMRDISARRRVIIGRNITLSAGIVYALSRAFYYVTIPEDSLSEAQRIITANGMALGFWGALWALAAVYCVVDMANRHTRHGLSAVVGLAFCWGIAYFLIWIFSGFSDPALISTAVGWLTPAALVFGLLFKVTALQDIIRRREVQ